MANKLDKEALIKHRFWIGLGLFVAIWLVGIIVVKVSGDDTKKKKYEDTKTAIEATKSKGVKTEAYQKPWNEFGSMFNKQKNKIWRAAWEQQANMYTWPEMPKPVFYPSDQFGDDDRSDVVNRDKFRNQLYPEEYRELKDSKLIYTVSYLGGFEKVFPPQVWDQERSPAREEIWLAQEDYWVRLEMLYIVRAALEGIVQFQQIKVDPKDKPAGVEDRRVFRNANFELNLLLVKASKGLGWEISDKSTIKNISVTKRTLPLATPGDTSGLPFILLQDGANYTMRIAGEPLAYEHEVPLKRIYSTDPVNLQKPFFIQQGLVWKNSPIRRIDALALGTHSHRTITSGLKVREDLKALDPEPKEEAPPPAASGAPGGAAGPGSAGTGAGGSGMAGAGFGGRGSDVDATRVNKIPRARYMHVTPQCRHLPIAMRVVLDQAHIHDFLSAAANSRLRIQITQVTFTNVSKQIDPPVETETDKGTSGPGRGGSGPAGGSPGGVGPGGGKAPGAGGSGGSGMGPPPGMGPGKGGGDDADRGKMYGQSGRGYGGGRPGSKGGFGMGGGRGGLAGAGGPGGPAGSGNADTGNKNQAKDTASLVELCVYGVASLYERFPPKPPAATAPVTTSPTGK